jgi:hypothetical protein
MSDEKGTSAENVEERSAPTMETNDTFDDPRHLPVFPTSVFEFTVKEAKELNLSLEEAMSKRKNTTDQPNWSTGINLHEEREDFGKLEDYILKSSGQVLDFLTFQYSVLAVTSLSANIVVTPDRSPPQVYSNNLLSGIYCLKAGGGKIVLSDPRTQAWMVRPNVTEVNVFNSDVFVIDLIEDKMIIIPSWLQRFMVFPVGETEENIYFNWTVMLQS